MGIISLLIAAVAVAAGLTACTPDQGSGSSAPQSSAQPAISEDQPVPPEQRRAAAASLLMPAALNFGDTLAKLNAGAGGIFIPSWADPELIGTPGRDIWALREAVHRPFDVAIDFEGGRVQRFSEILGDYPSAQVMAQGTPQEVEETAFAIGQSLAAHGLQRAGIKPVFKHYPGYGRASADTPPLEELFTFDLVPYDVALPQVTDPAIMMGHMVVLGLGDGHTPSSLNPAAYDLLRTHHNFPGEVYTDDLTGMKAIAADFGPDRAVVAAGADRALWSTDVDINFIIDGVVAAVEDGTIPPARFATAVEHVHERLRG